MKGKKITLSFWNNLNLDTKERALKLMNLPIWMANDKMTKDDIDWQIIENCARISDAKGYTLIMHGHMYIN